MIVSASYKTDIPAFYGEWFINRLKAGYCRIFNPYNRQASIVSLKRGDVDGFVFWTKNLSPFLNKLEAVHEQGFPFIVQYTINGYPRVLESSVVDAQRSVQHMRYIAQAFGSRVGVWRYDPVLVSSVTPLEFHRRNFSELARSLEGCTDEVVVSFAQVYRKTLRNMTDAAKYHGFVWEDPHDDAKLELISEFAAVASDHGMKLTVCAQNKYLVPGVVAANCIDATRLAGITGYMINAKVKGNRPDCACYVSKDIGEYDTCPHGCVYCYAVLNRDLAMSRFKKHDPSGEFIFTPTDAARPRQE